MNTEMQYEELKREIGLVAKGNTAIAESNEQIIALLSGNKLDKQDKGIIGMAYDHEERITKLEKLKDRLFWTVIGLALPGTYGVFTIGAKIIAAIK